MNIWQAVVVTGCCILSAQQGQSTVVPGLLADHRVVLALRDRTAASVFAALDVTLRRLGGAPTYVLTDNEKTVTVEHVAGMAVRNPQTVAFARHYGLTVHTCEPADPATKGGSEATVKLAKADLVPTETNLLPVYESFADLEQACVVFWEQVNARVHRVTRPAGAGGDARRGARPAASAARGPAHRRARPHPDRRGHHADVIALKGDSYRLKDRDLGRPPAATHD